MEIRLARNDKTSTCMSKNRTKIREYSLSIEVDNPKRKLICKAPTKAQFVLLWINSHKLHYYGIMKIYSFIYIYIYKWEKKYEKNIWKSKKICKSACQKENDSKFIKFEIFGDLEP